MSDDIQDGAHVSSQNKFTYKRRFARSQMQSIRDSTDEIVKNSL